jgi:hypothetical protein
MDRFSLQITTKLEILASSGLLPMNPLSEEAFQPLGLEV